MARRGKRAADSRGGGDIRSGAGGSKKWISGRCCCLLLENRESSGGGEKDGSAKAAWPPGLSRSIALSGCVANANCAGLEKEQENG